MLSHQDDLALNGVEDLVQGKTPCRFKVYEKRSSEENKKRKEQEEQEEDSDSESETDDDDDMQVDKEVSIKEKKPHEEGEEEEKKKKKKEKEEEKKKKKKKKQAHRSHKTASKGVPMRHRNDPKIHKRDGGLRHGGIRRLARRSGVKRIAFGTYGEVQRDAQKFLEDLANKAFILASHSRKKTIAPRHIVEGLRLMGTALYGY